MQNQNSAVENNVKEKNPDAFVAGVYDFAEAAVGAIVFIALLFIFVCRFLTVDGNSMNPTLSNNDRILASSTAYTAVQGDIVIITQPNSFDAPIVKRVIALGGQTVDIKNGKVYVDGEALDEPYVKEQTIVKGNICYPFTVPENCIFVMGDNRNHSTDSRFSSVGVIDERYILGKVLGRWIPVGKWSVYDNA